MGCPNECSHLHGLWALDNWTTIVTKSFLLHPRVPTKHCCFSMQVSQFHMIFPGFTHLAKETNCPLSLATPFPPVHVPQKLAAAGSAQTWRLCRFSSVFKRVYTFLVAHNSLSDHYSLSVHHCGPCCCIHRSIRQ